MLISHICIGTILTKEEMVYFTMHSKYFVYSYIEVGYMINDHIDNDQQQSIFYMHIPTERAVYTAFVTPVVEQWL